MNLIPKKCIVRTRSQCETKVQLGKYFFKLPVVPANMESVIDTGLALRLAQSGYFYIMHRFNVDIVEFVRTMHSLNLISSISIGVNDDSREVIDNLSKNDLKPDYITIDIAHGHSIKMQEMLSFVRKIFPDTYIIAGNISNPNAVRELEAWGANGIKVGIGPGSACTTYNATGFGSRGMQASVVKNCVDMSIKSDIIADGGIHVPGDIAKCLVLGAKFVMVGGMLSGFSDSPGDVIVDSSGNCFKQFWGSASEYSIGKTNRIEGIKKLIPLKNKTILSELAYLTECLQSSISYGGGTDLSCLTKVKFSIRPFE